MHAFPRSSLLVLQNNAVSALIPTSLIDEVDVLLDSNHINDAALLVDQRRRQLESNLTVDPDEAEELEYVYQTIGFKCFSQTLFEDAGRNLFNGALDPRILISYYPDLYGSLFSSTGQIDVYSGVAERMPSDKNVDELRCASSCRTQTSIRKCCERYAVGVLGEIEEARESGKEERRLFTSRRRPDRVIKVVDTVLAKLYALHDRIQELRALLTDSNDVVLSEIEPSLRKLGFFSLLADLYQKQGQEDKLLDLYSACAEGAYSNTDIEDPLQNIVTLLESKKDKDRKQQVKWGLWILQRGDLEHGMKMQLLIPPDTPKRRERDRDREDDLSLLEQITSANQAAGKRFLEYLVVTKRSTSSELHTRLALSCVDELLQCLEDETTLKLWRAKAYFASTTPNSPSKRTRLKTIMMLSGSGLYDANVVKDRIRSARERDLVENYESGKGKGKTIDVLALESAILDGKLGHHALALSTLVHDLRDSVSAETYCTLGGEVVPAKLALATAESTAPSASSSVELALKEWYLGLFEPLQVPKSKRGGVGAMGGMESAMVRQRSVKDEVKTALLTDLIGVYSRDGALGVERTKRLLDSQGVNLDVVDIVTLVPDDWPLSSLNTFLARHFRRTLHKMHENTIQKNLSAGQNLAVRERSYPILRDAGYLIEEPDSEDELGGVVDEKAAYVQVEEVVEKMINRDDVVNEKTPSPDYQPQRHVLQEQQSAEEVEESVGAVHSDSRDEAPGQGRVEERSMLGLILDEGVSGERDGDSVETGDEEEEGRSIR
ncbi:hypothetical protein AGABI2DRAFT_179862 [Agaricus bisporus var. bisporus H97]|uniref:hypothetical protein n=1 Tax=Agaricus bisporus var. bisporus (strain H97 / ATCC MYA-4626 / FGSC 10389) TaxID=936046 RepID=UPI00029F667E|nr:hypothetical protein AGABI2DRAFT_179862 [Agaricus bisporus var. bisporus H97]EKV45395.1 hypothetical protein AGABI2DRAFT_179862 [Agaricus bisporus var. bisporus H97]